MHLVEANKCVRTLLQAGDTNSIWDSCFSTRGIASSDLLNIETRDIMKLRKD